LKLVRKEEYWDKRERGLCVYCSKKPLKNVTVCKIHREKKYKWHKNWLKNNPDYMKKYLKEWNKRNPQYYTGRYRK